MSEDKTLQAESELHPALERMLVKWESRDLKWVMLPATAMTCDVAASRIREAIALSARNFWAAIARAEAAEARIAELEKALERIVALDNQINVTPRGKRKVVDGVFAKIARRALGGKKE